MRIEVQDGNRILRFSTKSYLSQKLTLDQVEKFTKALQKMKDENLDSIKIDSNTTLYRR